MKRRLLVVLPFVILILGFVLMRTLTSFREEEPKREPVVRPKVVQTKVVQLQDIPAQLEAYGRLKSTQPVVLISEVSGTLMQGSIAFQPGQSFQKGDLLVKVDDRQMRLELNSTKSDLMTALATVLPEINVDFPDEYQEWQDYFNSISFDSKLPALPETSNQKIKLFLARFNVYKLFFAAQNLEIRLEKHFFYAPFDGSILSTNLRVGSTAAPGARLGELINLESLEVEVPIPAKDVKWINMQQPVRLTSNDLGESWNGRINRIGSAIDDRTQSVQAYITITQNGVKRLYDGAFIDALIPGETIANSFAVPRRAIYEERYVYVIKNGKFDYIPVDITFETQNEYIVNGGLASGDTLVVELLQGVAPGMPAMSQSAAAVAATERSGS